ncbi:MAG: dihydroorotase [bacterium]
MKLLIKNGLVVDPANKIEDKLDVLVNNGKIEKVGKNISDKGAKVIDAKGCLVIPGMIDMHVHFREPGFEYKETIASGARAAAKGGFTTVCCMPNTNPPIDNQALVDFILFKSKEAGLIDVLPIGTITKGRAGEELSAIGELVTAGAVAISDDGSPVMNAEILRRALEYCKIFNIPVIEHCEDKNLSGEGQMNEGFYATKLGLKGIPKAAEETMVARDIIIAGEMNARIHIAHVSTAGSCELIRQGKKNGVMVTAETAPHYFALDDSALEGYDTNFKMSPPLRSKEDIKAIKKAIKEGVIDVIATDHAPHAELDKNIEFNPAAFGIIGLETAFSIMVEELIASKAVPLSTAIAAVTINSAKILRLNKGTLTEGVDADITIANMDKTVKITEEFFASKSTNSPFIGRTMTGTIEYTIKNGRIVYENK